MVGWESALKHQGRPPPARRQTPPPLWIIDGRLWKHYLPHTPYASCNKREVVFENPSTPSPHLPAPLPCKMTIARRRRSTFCVSVQGPSSCGRRVLHLLLYPEVPPTNLIHYTQVLCYLCSLHGNVRCVFVVWRLVKYLHVAKCWKTKIWQWNSGLKYFDIIALLNKWHRIENADLVELLSRAGGEYKVKTPAELILRNFLVFYSNKLTSIDFLFPPAEVIWS